MIRVTHVAIGVVACALAFAPRASAQDGTIEQLVATALERSPEIRAARTAVDSAKGQLTQAGLRPNPALTGTQQQLSGGTHETLVGVDWPLDLFRRQSRVAVAQRTAEATSLSVQNRERVLAAEVRAEAGRLLAARRNVEVMNEALAAARRMRELLDSRVTEGDTPKLDANIAAVEVGRMEADVIIAQADADAAAIELKALAGLAPEAQLLLRDSLEELVRIDLRELVRIDTAAAAPPPDADVLAARADIREATTRVELAGARVDQARREGRLDMTLSGSFDRMRFGFPQLAFNNTGTLVPINGLFSGVLFGARLTMPVRNKNQGAVAAAEAERSGETEMLAARQLAARAELDAAVVRDREALRAVELYATTIRDQARQNVDVELEAYDLGRTPLSDLLAEQRRYLDVEAAYTSALSRAYLARVSLRRARGEIR
jgi:outer membrane protein, heavy metal efflux system